MQLFTHKHKETHGEWLAALKNDVCGAAKTYCEYNVCENEWKDSYMSRLRAAALTP